MLETISKSHWEQKKRGIKIWKNATYVLKRGDFELKKHIQHM